MPCITFCRPSGAELKSLNINSEIGLMIARGGNRRFEFNTSLRFELVNFFLRKAQQLLQHHCGMFAEARIGKGIGRGSET